MADFIRPTDLTSELISAGLNPNDPENTYVDFAQKLAANRQQQAEQEQQIARARELTKQAQIETKHKVTADEAGYNPELADTMTPAEAVAYLKIVLKEKGLQQDEALIDEWAKALPPRVNRQIVESFANRFARETTRSGQPAKFEITDNIIVPAGKSAADLGLTYFESEGIDDSQPSDGKNSAHVPEEGMYQVVYDNQGNVVKFVPGGKEPVDQTARLALKESESAEKQWQKLDAALNTFIRSQRGNMLISSLVRADRALNELATNETLTPQVLDYIREDISGIFTGGVPPISGREGTTFETAYQAVNRFIQKYSGTSGFFHTDLGNQRDYLLGLVSRLRESTVDIVKTMIESEASGYKKIIGDEPDRWEQMKADKVGVLASGLTATAKEAAKEKKAPTEATPIPGVKAAGAKAKKPVPKYTVEK